MMIATLTNALGIVGTQDSGVTRAEVPADRFAHCADVIVNTHGQRLALLYATDDRAANQVYRVHALYALDQSHDWLLISAALPEDAPHYPSLTRTVMAAHWYERYAMDMFGIVADGHPDPRRLVHHENIPLGTHPLRKDFAWNTVLPQADVPYPMHHVEGAGIFEIPVGPIHAGIIEPGHFRFNVAGERIITVEGKLFFTHKGVEKILEGKTPAQALPFVERVSGDMAAAHALAFAEAVEAATGTQVPMRAAQLRVLLNELERLTMHIHDIVNMCGMGTGFTVMAAQGFRLKEQLVRLSDRLCGNRFWRGMVVPGGWARDLDAAALTDLRTITTTVTRDVLALVEMARHSDGLRERLETTGILHPDAATAYGAVGIAARASGLARDARVDHPSGAYATHAPRIVVEHRGDVYARFRVRYQEIEASATFILHLIDHLASGPVRVECTVRDGFGLAAVESWRGEIITVVHLRAGVIERCVIRDPSFCNWALFGELAPGNIVPDFPLCNKSLDLSYSGTDL